MQHMVQSKTYMDELTRFVPSLNQFRCLYVYLLLRHSCPRIIVAYPACLPTEELTHVTRSGTLPCQHKHEGGMKMGAYHMYRHLRCVCQYCIYAQSMGNHCKDTNICIQVSQKQGFTKLSSNANKHLESTLHRNVAGLSHKFIQLHMQNISA